MWTQQWLAQRAARPTLTHVGERCMPVLPPSVPAWGIVPAQPRPTVLHCALISLFPEHFATARLAWRFDASPHDVELDPSPLKIWRQTSFRSHASAIHMIRHAEMDAIHVIAMCSRDHMPSRRSRKNSC
jgi:hypothetical protein